MANFIFIGIGGFLGANARYLFTVWITTRFGATFPAGTLFVNFAGSLLLALFLQWSSHQVELPNHIRLLVGTGFFGAFTTFSTFATETVLLAQTGHWAVAAGNVIVTNVVCILGVVAGLALASRVS